MDYEKKFLLDRKEIESQNISYCIFGEGDIDLVIEMGLGAVSGEWWHIAERLSKQFTVLLYERGRNISKPRSPKNIAVELHTLLKKLPCKSKIKLGFTPRKDETVLFEAALFDGGDDYRLFCRGTRLESIEKEKLYFPTFSHA